MNQRSNTADQIIAAARGLIVAGGYNGFDNTGQVIIVGTAGVFCIEFDVVDKVLGPFHRLNGSFQYFFPG